MKLSSLAVLIKEASLTSAWLTLSLLFPLSESAQAVSLTSVDFELSLLIDVSGSVKSKEFNLQKQGFVDAFNDPAIVSKIQNGTNGSIAVNFIYWSSDNRQQEAVGWTLIEDTASASAFASAISATTRPFEGLTSISGALDFAVPLFDTNEFDGTRQVIDVASDGENNDGREVTDARDDALNEIDTINGLTILNEELNLDNYFTDNAIGGPDSFVLAVDDFSDFGDGISSKLEQEITPSPVPGEPTPIPFEFSPGLGIFMLGVWSAIAQLNSLVQNRKSS